MLAVRPLVLRGRLTVEVVGFDDQVARRWPPEAEKGPDPLKGKSRMQG